jgi:hypothetical protein
MALENLQALYQVTVLLILTFKGNDILNLKHDNTGRADKVRNTVIFNAFVFCQVSLQIQFLYTFSLLSVFSLASDMFQSIIFLEMLFPPKKSMVLIVL